MNLRLGTRRSLLAWAQSGQVARAIEAANPGVTVELVGIDTRGDKIQDIPLQKVEGKEFFVAEIDDALREKRTDLSVHSLKDLSLERPAEFILGATPKRQDARDVLIFAPRAEARIRAGEPLRIGTSSPRRLENIPAFLMQVLPRWGKEPVFDFKEIRGNVNTRLSRLHEPDSSERALDGVVLALAGLNRLWLDEKGREELTRLFLGVRFMVLPLRENPTAPGQGALAVECRRDDERVTKILSKIHHEPSARQVASERAILEAWGGGCHQKFGASETDLPGIGPFLMIRGKRPNGADVDEARWIAPSHPGGEVRLWESSVLRASRPEKAAEDPGMPPALRAGECVFVSHSRAVPDSLTWVSELSRARVWVSGTSSWIRLAKKGLWVEGSAEGFGFDFIRETLESPALSLSTRENWTILTHRDALENWSGTIAVGTYTLPKYEATQTEKEEISEATDLYWTSGSLFEAFSKHACKGARHACGPGATRSAIEKAGFKALVFPSLEDWKRWIQKR